MPSYYSPPPIMPPVPVPGIGNIIGAVGGKIAGALFGPSNCQKYGRDDPRCSLNNPGSIGGRLLAKVRERGANRPGTVQPAERDPVFTASVARTAEAMDTLAFATKAGPVTDEGSGIIGGVQNNLLIVAGIVLAVLFLRR